MFIILGIILGVILFFVIGDSKKRMDYTRSQRESGWGGRCDGDCENCPPHYGYRYGRYYYGHDHSHGCEFGGNKCSGSRD